ncbi:MAG TPA: hypothetical protein ENO21_04905, partial [Firmicutes bacterium]|nr:hypothetical protein [Bacillota bacterium]
MSVRAVIVTDGKRGHENQSRVVARMAGDQAPLVMQLRDSVKDGGIGEWMLRTRMRMGGGRSLGLQPAARMVRKYLAPEDTRAFRDFAAEVQREQHERTVVISTGTPPATFNLVVAGMLKATSIVVMTPSLLPRNLFGLNIVPAHDWRGGEVPANVIVSALALAHFDETAAEHLTIRLRREHELSRAHVYWGLALGGPSKSAPWQREHL